MLDYGAPLAVLLILSHNFLRIDVVTANDYFRAIMFLVIATVLATLSEQNTKTKLELFDYQGKLRSLASEVSLVEERQKRQIATELHDHFGQELVLLRLKLDEMKKSSPSVDFADELAAISAKIKEIIRKLRSLTFELCPATLYELGFEKAVAELLAIRVQQEHGIETEFDSDGQLESLEENTKVVLFQAIRELLVNVVRHAQARIVKVSTQGTSDEIRVIVQDDGVGFDPAEITASTKTPGKLGLFSVRERVGYLRGRVEIESERGKGSRIVIILPIEEPKTNAK